MAKFLLPLTTMLCAHCWPIDGVLLYFRSKTYDVRLAEESNSQSSCCRLQEVLEHVHTISYDTDPDGDDIPDSIRVCLDKQLAKESIIGGCGRCFELCKLFKEIEGHIEEENTVTLNIPNANLGCMRVDDSNAPAYLGLRSDDGSATYIVLYNLNDACFAANSIFLRSTADNIWVRLLDTKGKLEVTNIPANSINLSDIKLPSAYAEVVKEGASVFTLKNMIIGVLVYYTMATVSVLIYFNFFKKPDNQEIKEQ